MLAKTATLKKAQYAQNRKGDILQLVLALCIRHGNVGVSMAGMECVESLLSCMTAQMLEQTHEAHKKTLRMLLHIFGALVSEAMVGSANSMQISLNIRAFGTAGALHCAPPRRAEAQPSPKRSLTSRASTR